MKIILYNNYYDFLSQNEELLIENESLNNLKLGLAHNFKDVNPPDPAQIVLAIEAGGEIVAQAIRTSQDKNLILSPMKSDWIEMLVGHLKAQEVQLFGVVGEMKTSQSFAALWATKNELSIKLKMHQGIYQLSFVEMPKDVQGAMVVASEEYWPDVLNFAKIFSNECFPGDENAFDEQLIRNRLDQGKVYLWQNPEGENVSMAVNNRNSKNAATISWVVTPPVHRGKGYASVLVATLSQKLLDGGKTFCNLFTDLSNPSSNSIYQKIGYELLGYSKDFMFIERE